MKIVWERLEVMIRFATEEDAEELLRIYSYYVEQDKTKKKILHDRTVQALEETYTEKAE